MLLPTPLPPRGLRSHIQKDATVEAIHGGRLVGHAWISHEENVSGTPQDLNGRR